MIVYSRENQMVQRLVQRSPKDGVIHSEKKAWTKGEKAIVSCFLEDFAQVILQYYYFEKFSFLPPDAFTYFNAAFMMFTAAHFLVIMFKMLFKRSIKLFSGNCSQENFKIDSCI